MAAVVPNSVKTACPDIQRLATRAAQLQKFRPIVSYWCEYYILQLILAKGLHTADEASTQYAAELMDKVEQYKADNTTNDAVIDDVAAKAYIENFALDTFNKGDQAQRANSVTKQTADTFQAAATFMELLNIWSPLDTEIQAKVKFAKFHALRIAKALRAGEDPNATNPVIEEQPEPQRTEDDGLEEELKNMENDAGVYKQPTAETATDITPRGDSLHQPPLPTGSDAQVETSEADVSPIDPADNVNSRAGSVGGGYFPNLQDDAPSNVNSAGSIDQQPPPAAVISTPNPADFYNQAQPTSDEINRPSRPTPHQATAQPPAVSASPAISIPPPRQAIAPAPSTQSAHNGPPAGGYTTDDDAIMAAQKHAKWAISALNFEDVTTAVKELRIALGHLGAS